MNSIFAWRAIWKQTAPWYDSVYCFFFRVGRVEQRVCPLKWTTIATLSVSPLLGKLGMQAVEPCHGHYDDVADHGLVKDGGDGERHDRIMPTR